MGVRFLLWAVSSHKRRLLSILTYHPEDGGAENRFSPIRAANCSSTASHRLPVDHPCPDGWEKKAYEIIKIL
jgi:hypothetical protein